MTIRFKSALFIFFGLLGIWFVVTQRAALAPFVLGGLFAYLFNPVVALISRHIKLPRVWSASILYVLLVIFVVIVTTITTRRIITEFDDIQRFVNYFLLTTRSQINNLPDWIRPTVYDLLLSIQKSRAVNSSSLLPFFPQAISRTISFIVFLVSGYYFLREGDTYVEKIISWVPKKYAGDIEGLLVKISNVLGAYLRGQIFLVFFMSVITFVALTILGVRFSLFLGIFSGFAEIVPIIGPIIAAALAILVVLMTGTVNFGLNPVNGAIIVAVLYFVFRHVEDYFVIPHLMGKITKLSPFIVFFAVVIGGHLWGILGLILAVPVAAVIKILVEYFVVQIDKSSKA